MQLHRKMQRLLKSFLLILIPLKKKKELIIYSIIRELRLTFAIPKKIRLNLLLGPRYLEKSDSRCQTYTNFPTCIDNILERKKIQNKNA